jgi:nucleoside-diphosphate-sugar epimerase
MKIIVTGGNGFLGSNLIRKFILEGHTVYAFSSKTTNILDILDQIEFDFSHTNNIISFIDKIKKFEPDVVVHCGWSGGNNYDDVNDIKQFYDNIEPSINLLSILNELPKKPKFVGFGSFSEYGPYVTQINENDIEHPINLYGLSKLTFKNYSEIICELNNIDWVWIRPCYVYGPYDVKTRLIPLLISKFLNNEEITLDKCDKIIDYIYIDDFTEYVYNLIITQNNGVFNICSGDQYNLKDIINLIHTLVGSDSKISYTSIINRKLTSSHICGDDTKIRAVTGLYPKVNIKDGILKTINFFKTNIK